MRKIVSAVFKDYQLALKELYDENESAHITHLVFEKVLGLRRIDLTIKRNAQISDDDFNKLMLIRIELEKGRPVQYVLGETSFFDLTILVNENVLIPRPETEELIYLIRKKYEGKPSPSLILDLCTGSGCIALALKKIFPEATVIGTDVSKVALEIAVQNAHLNNLKVEFKLVDLFSPNALNHLSSELGKIDLIVSNPPYVKWSESLLMHSRIIDYEPPLALFVPDNDPVIFYRSIAGYGKRQLNTNGKIFVEINEALGTQTLNIFTELNYSAFLFKDLNEKPRMIEAQLMESIE